MPELANQPAHLKYPNIVLDGQNPLRVDRLVTPADAFDAAPGIQQLMRDTYTQLFATGDSPLMQSEAINAQFNPDDPQAIAEQAQRILDWTNGQQSQYWVASIPREEESTLVGFAKVTPSRPRLFVRGENIYLNDIAIQPEMQGRSVDLALLRSIMRFGGYSESAYLVTDTFAQDVRFNQCLTEEFAMAKTGRTVMQKICGAEVAMHRVVTRRSTDIGRIASRLERNHPELVSLQ